MTMVPGNTPLPIRKKYLVFNRLDGSKQLNTAAKWTAIHLHFIHSL